MRRASISILLFSVSACANSPPAVAPTRDLGAISFWHGDEFAAFPQGFCWGLVARPIALLGTADEQAIGVGRSHQDCLRPGQGVTWGGVVSAGAYRIHFMHRRSETDEWKICEAFVTVAPGVTTNIVYQWPTQARCTTAVVVRDEFPAPGDRIFREIAEWRAQWLSVARDRCAARSTRKGRRACQEHERDLLRWKTVP